MRINLLIICILTIFTVGCSKKQPETNRIEAAKINPLGRSFGA
ncbi:hypothetical protein PF022_08600 [Helicobacter sp. WB40]|nr:hypothetical protein [Helicobacter sp. WB40]MDA3968013.1 hypothetical protein [Helicobacter sp. WB40]